MRSDLNSSDNTISGIDELRSASVEGVSTVIATFVLGQDGDVGAQEVRDKVNLILSSLPETIEQPVIQKVDPDATPVLCVAVSAPLPLREVTEVADKQIVKRSEGINGIGAGTNRRRSIHLHQSIAQRHRRAFNDCRFIGIGGDVFVSVGFSLDDHFGFGDSHLNHCDVWIDGGDGRHAESNYDAGPNADGRHCD